MANFNARIRKNKVNADGKSNIKIRITHKGATRYIGTKYYIEDNQFDNRAGRVKPAHPNAIDININLQALELTYQRKILKLEAKIKTIQINDLVEYLIETDNFGALDFFAVAQKRIEFLQRIKKDSSAAILDHTIKNIKDYSGAEILPFVGINPEFLKGFESWYKMKGTQNSAAIHLRNVRTIFNIAIDDHGLSPELYPFRRFKIRTVATIHRDITPEEIARLYEYKPKQHFEAVARDLWLLSFFLVGINFKDLIYLKTSFIRKGRITYTRAKTSTIFSVRIEQEAQKIIDRYIGREYILKVIEDKETANEKKDRSTPLYKDVTDRTNRILKRITKAINTDANGKTVELIDPELSTYYARHSWGTIASRLGVSHDVIREALGHSRTVTDTYINFYTQKIDEANRKIIDEVFKFCRPIE